MNDKETARRQPPTRKFLVRLFAIGSVLLVCPLLVVLYMDSSCIKACFSVEGVVRSLFLYPMLLGGLLLGYGMKKVAETQNEESKE